MSDTHVDSSTNQTTAQGGRHGYRPVPGGEAEPTGWVGWIMFAAVMMIMLGIFHAIAGLVALFDDGYYVVSQNDLVVHVDYTGWGWIHLIGGVLVAAAGVSLFAGKMWARIIAVCLAAVSMIINIAFFGAYPWWSALMIAFDVLVIWALTVHGAEMRTVHDEDRY